MPVSKVSVHLVNLAAGHAAVLVTFDAKIRPVLSSDDQPRVRALE